MTIENDALCEDLRAWMRFPAIGLPEYCADPIVRRRVGRMLAKYDDFTSPEKKTNVRPAK